MECKRKDKEKDISRSFQLFFAIFSSWWPYLTSDRGLFVRNRHLLRQHLTLVVSPFFFLASCQRVFATDQEGHLFAIHLFNNLELICDSQNRVALSK